MSFRSGVKTLRALIAAALARLAYRLSPAGVSLALSGSTARSHISHGPAQFYVERWVAGRYFCLYSGPDGALARRTFEGVRERQEVGRMELVMRDATGSYVRGSYGET